MSDASKRSVGGLVEGVKGKLKELAGTFGGDRDRADAEREAAKRETEAARAKAEAQVHEARQEGHERHT